LSINPIIRSFPDSLALLSRLGSEGEIVPTPGHSDDSISLILNEGKAFTGDLLGRDWGADPMRQIEASWRRIGASNFQMICNAAKGD